LIQTFPDPEEEFKVWTEKELYFVRLHSLKYVSENQYQYIFSQSKKSNIIDNIFSKEIFGEYKLNQESNIIITASDRKRDLLFDVIQIFSESFFCINCGNN
jgi:hypothetical protein